MGPLTTADSVPVTRGAAFPLLGRCVVVSRGRKGSEDPSPGPRRAARPVTVTAFAFTNHEGYSTSVARERRGLGPSTFGRNLPRGGTSGAARALALLDRTIRQAWGPARPLVVDSNDQLSTLTQFSAIAPERDHVEGETTCESLHPAG